MKGYFFAIILMAAVWTTASGHAHSIIGKCEFNTTVLTTNLQRDGLIIIYQDFYETRIEFANIGLSIGFLIDSNGKIVWEGVIDAQDKLTFNHNDFERKNYSFVLENLSGQAITIASVAIM